jgi:hypothetical protein
MQVVVQAVLLKDPRAVEVQAEVAIEELLQANLVEILEVTEHLI